MTAPPPQLPHHSAGTPHDQRQELALAALGQASAEDALRQSEERLRMALDAGQVGIWDWDISADRVTWSERIYALHDMVPGSFGGRIEDFGLLIHPDDVERVMATLDRTLRLGEPYAAEYRFRRADGSVRWLATQGYVSRDAQGQPIRMVGAASDVTERVGLLAAERSARQAAEAAR
ncbi:MAG: PAS domain-containing protein, partial [Ramlibacter sp.]|nr:PAS domain-containing protein [Ramlibacter sp.]